MKRSKNFNIWGAIALSVVMFFSCDPTETPDPNDPGGANDPTPTEFVKPEVFLVQANNVTETTALLTGSFKANEAKTKVFFEYKTVNETSYHKKELSGFYTGVDTIKVTFDLSDLATKKTYSFRLVAENPAGSDTSDAVIFSTELVRDYNGNVYHVVQIGSQYWLQENLKATNYADGTPLLNAADDGTWRDTELEAYCWYNNDINLGKIYGGLYNRKAVTSPKKFIAGFHLPTNEEFSTLINYVGGPHVSEAKLSDGSGKYWQIERGRTNEFGFTDLPAGKRYKNDDQELVFERLGINSYIHTASTDWVSSVFVGDGFGGLYGKYGISARFIKD